MTDSSPHVFLNRDDVTGRSMLFRLIAEGGLHLCKSCRGGKGELTTDCPGVLMTAEQREGVASGKLDFIRGAWVHLGSAAQGT